MNASINEPVVVESGPVPLSINGLELLILAKD